MPTGSLRVSVGMDSRISGFAVRYGLTGCAMLWFETAVHASCATPHCIDAREAPSMSETSYFTITPCTVLRTQTFHVGAHRCAFETGVASKGASVANCGLATTPAMFFSCVATGHQYDGGVMATASHLPFNRNGLKFFTKHGGLQPAPEFLFCIWWHYHQITADTRDAQFIFQCTCLQP